MNIVPAKQVESKARSFAIRRHSKHDTLDTNLRDLNRTNLCALSRSVEHGTLSQSISKPRHSLVVAIQHGDSIRRQCLDQFILRARDAFGCYLGFGITAMFGLQALVNLGVVIGALPTKGLPLPFVSFGGSTLVVDLFAMGILLNISKAAPEPAGARVKGPWLPRIRWRAKKGNRRLPGGGKRIEVT